MDFLIEFLGEFLFEVPFEVTMESRKVKTWVKTVLFCLLGGVLTALFAFMTVSIWMNDRNITGVIVLAVITLGWVIFVILGAIRGHKRKWKQN